MPLNRQTLEPGSSGSASILGLTPFPEEAVEPFVRHLARAMSAPMAALFLKQTDKLFLHCGAGLPDSLEAEREIPYFLSEDSRIPPRLLIEDTQTDRFTADAAILRTLEWRSMALLQFGVETGASALLCVADREPRVWTERDSAVLTEVAGLILQQVRRELRARDDAAHRRILEGARQQIEQRYRRLFESSRDAIYMTTAAGKFTDANPSMVEMFGYSRKELMQINAGDLYVDEEERGRYQQEIEKAGSIRQHEVRLKRKDGTVIDCLRTATAQRDHDGKIVGYQGIIHDISARKRTEEQLAHNAFHDALTGLPNRSLFMDRLERVVRTTKRHPETGFAVLFMDLDRFKMVNDSMGHAVGDQLLQEVGRRMERCIRLEDTVARMGGDEFAVLVNSVKDAGDATRVAERVISELSLPFTLDGNELLTSTSIGVAISYSGNLSADRMIRDADAAMYRAKTSGRSRYQVFDPLQHTEAVTHMQIETDLRQALQAHEFVLVYQPVIDIQNNRLAGFEAFLRWQHPTRGLLVPADFMEVAEETGLILPIGWWVLEQSCMQMHEWEAELRGVLGPLTISVNVSGKQFYQPDLVTHLEQILVEAKTSPTRLKLEVPENIVMRNAESAARILKQLRERGILLSIDDFGTGYSSLRYLQQFPVTTLKIDQSFVSAVADEAERGLVNSIVALGRSIGVDALAEGVETKAQLDWLRALGVRYAQGYYFSEPVDAEKAAQFIVAGGI